MFKRFIYVMVGFIALGMGIRMVPVSSHAQEGYPEVTVLLGNTEDRMISSSIVNYTYRISVALPLSYYTDPSRNYPVLYVLDPHLSFGTVTDVVRVAAIGGELPELIVVGIGYPEDIIRTRALRERDYSREAESFLRFIRDELVPLIDADYRTDPSDRGIIGHSYGGDFVLYALFHAPELFSRYIAGSPNFNSAAAFEGQPTLSAKVLVSIGARDEASSSEKLLANFVETLENYEGLELTTMIFPGATHFASRPLHHVSGIYSIYGLRQ